MNERRAFLHQAASDFLVFKILSGRDRVSIPECHPLHYLQMATEKCAKASLGDSVNEEIPHCHVAFSKIPFVLRRRDVAKKLGWKSFNDYRTFLDRIKPLARAIDELNPAVGPQQTGGGKREGPNVEYPWPSRDIDGNKTWIAPVDHRFGLLEKMRSGDGAQMIDFLRRLLERANDIFGLSQSQ